eukprot:758015-Hanusia_phi.AAC.1
MDGVSWDVLIEENNAWKKLKEDIFSEAASDSYQHIKLSKEKFKDDTFVMDKEMPAGLITAICVRYRMLPGPQLSALRRQLLSALEEKKLTQAPDQAYGKRLSYQDVFAYIENNGLLPNVPS